MTPSRTAILPAALLALAAGGAAFAQGMTHSGMAGMTHGAAMPDAPAAAAPAAAAPVATAPAAAERLPREPGQGAFAAIAEIVAMLASDPATDWGRADIGALRDHLIDIDDLMREAAATAREIPGGLEMTVATAGRGGAAAARMVPAHAPALAAETGWRSVARAEGGALVWTVTSGRDAARIRALGFFGLMATGSHHRAHHLAIVTGGMAR